MPNPKTPSASRLGVFYLCLGGALLVLAGSAQALCPAPRVDEQVRLARVHDGDTLQLADGRRVRVLGINTPEVAGSQRQEEALGRAARAAAESFFRGSSRIKLMFDEEKQDRYGRLLAHVYDESGQSLAARLLRDGLAFQVVVPPNRVERECLSRQESAARAEGLGVWRHKYWRSRDAADLDLKRDTGFLRVSGRVVRVTEGRDIWVELDGPLVLRIRSADKRYFTGKPWRRWQDQRLEARGWIINRQTPDTAKKGFKPLQLDVRTPDTLILLPQP